ncbi:hypothetical protein P872_22040 [Rhodonellum psychrophilum GCM71 = DSM 17998]|uniref:Uncharacterized protein n=1 Tax=Rhodonellum psychrophilum GCM71 = DSM 17998 TaxID=1123057 RepID=U5BRX8_9BACT|nr:hypothetical protein P872_22040 [Rhodonellum psychrophilum GCM71 = DSM 17998]
MAFFDAPNNQNILDLGKDLHNQSRSKITAAYFIYPLQILFFE